jgi:homoserine O-acetyltransferase
VENKRIAHALNAVAAQVSFVEIKSDKGHDAFLLDEPEMFATGARLSQSRGTDLA